eukprot:TRINITY_DN4217_c0_g1_i1.p1 TRINITY_DN4217_c0_g1~~TRINITY_DN4217_c0_g1_i1.p1  ORF type:complete len:222 (-),score=62.43 TRINITY_DN4217_c0_g1_i1:49-714(-)
MASIKVLFVDGGGVLLSAVPNPMLRELAKRYPEYKETIETAHSRNPKPWHNIKLRKDYTEEQFWHDLLEEVQIKESAEELGLMLRDSIQLYQDVYDICAAVRQNGILTGILSNHGTGWVDYVVEKYGLGATFDKDMVLVSQAIGYDKPDVEVYEALWNATLKKLETTGGGQISKDQVVFVDDKLANVEAANKFGLRGVQFDHLKETGDDLKRKLAQVGLTL